MGELAKVNPDLTEGNRRHYGCSKWRSPRSRVFEKSGNWMPCKIPEKGCSGMKFPLQIFEFCLLNCSVMCWSIFMPICAWLTYIFNMFTSLCMLIIMIIFMQKIFFLPLPEFVYLFDNLLQKCRTIDIDCGK